MKSEFLRTQLHSSSLETTREYLLKAVSLHTWVCWIQGVYFAATGLWPLISIETFQMVTGQKTDHLVTGDEADHWLVNTVGALVAAISIVFLAAAWSKRATIDVVILGISAAIALTAIDVVYVARGTISPVYLVDAAAEVVFIAMWLAVLGRGKLWIKTDNSGPAVART